MSSRPVLAALEANIEASGGEDAIFDRIADGERVRDIMASFGVSRPMFWQWLKHGGGAREERRQAKYAAAKRASAEAIHEDGGEILDDLANQPASQITPALVALAGKRADWRRHMAAVRNPDVYGDKAGIQVNVNLGSLHLDALRQLKSTRHELPTEEQPLRLEPGDDAS